MNIYTKNGDKGTTDLLRTKNVSKSDDRIQLVGAIEELSCHVGLIKTMLEDKETVRTLEKIQGSLESVIAGVNDPYNRDYHLSNDKTEFLEEEIGRMKTLFDSSAKFLLPGGSRLSAEIDVTRTVARRAERALASVSVKFGADTGAKKYMNRLADYFYVLARYADAKDKKAAASKEPGQTEAPVLQEEISAQPKAPAQFGGVSREPKAELGEALIQEVLKRAGLQSKMTLKGAKSLIDQVEKEAVRRGMKAAIAVCTPEGNPIAVHVMDGAFLVSFEAAVKKAYTAAAVQMPTLDFGRLAQPGQTFFGADKLRDVVTFGGGVPIKVGDRIIGGIGVSGGTGEEDHDLAQYGASCYVSLR